MASISKIIQNIQSIIEEKEIDAPLENITVSVRTPEIINEDLNTVCYERKKLIIEEKEYYSEEKMIKNAWIVDGWGKNI